MKRVVLVLALIAGLSACNQGDERLAEKARIEGREAALTELEAQFANLDRLIERARAEGRAQAEEGLRVQQENIQTLLDRARQEGRANAESQVSVERAYLAERAAQMEWDLARRQRFYQAVAGTYEGVTNTDQGLFNVRITLFPTIPPYIADRVRNLDEITFDLTNLSFNVQILQWNPKNALSAVGCRVEVVRPDILNGVIHIASEGCPNFYSLRLSDNQDGILKKPESIAAGIREGTIETVHQLSGEIHPTTNASIYRFSVSKLTR